MAYKYMTKVNFDVDSPNKGAIFHEKITVANAVESDEIILPIDSINAITVDIQGNGTLALTNSSPDEIEAGNAVYSNWDGTSLINVGVTGFKFTGGSGGGTLRATVRTNE